MRKLAWLHAVPEGQKKSRMTTLRAANPDQPALQLPELGDGAYIVQMLHEAGLMSSVGMGSLPLSWQELEAWLRVTESEPELWEKMLVRELSEAYVSELNQATERNRPSPWNPPVEEVEQVRATVVSRFMAFAKQFNEARAKKQDESENGSIPSSG